MGSYLIYFLNPVEVEKRIEKYDHLDSPPSSTTSPKQTSPSCEERTNYQLAIRTRRN